MSEIDILLRGGLIVDGTGHPPYEGSLAVRGDRIAFVGPGAPQASARSTIELAGLAVAPGFIDIHGHTDFNHLCEPRSLSKVHDGVTTELSGNCGVSAFPISLAERDAAQPELDHLGILCDWTKFPGYAAHIETLGTGINRAYLVGHGSLRTMVMGSDDRPATAEEMATMECLLRESLDAGAFGLSTGLIYAPGCFAPQEELHRLAAVVRQAEGLYASHIRGEQATVIEAVEEILETARVTGVRTQISHLKASRRENWCKLDRLIALIEEARGEGYTVHADRYPYTATNTGLDAVFPPWAKAGGKDRMLDRLKSTTERARLRAALHAEYPVDYWSRVILATAPEGIFTDSIGQSVAAIAADKGLPPLDTVLEIIACERSRCAAIYHSLSEENLVKVLSLPWVMPGSDAGARSLTGPTSEGKPHPRAYGTFARILGRYGRDLGLFDLAEAIRRITSLPAAALGLLDRGRLAPGLAADLTIFDPDGISDRATFETPKQLSFGVTHVLVNGRFTIRDGEHLGTLAGRVLRRQRPAPRSSLPPNGRRPRKVLDP